MRVPIENNNIRNGKNTKNTRDVQAPDIGFYTTKI